MLICLSGFITSTPRRHAVPGDLIPDSKSISSGLNDANTPSVNSRTFKKCAIHAENLSSKRTRSQNSYELSEDFLQKQIEFIERKYGAKATKSAVIIQKAYRQYAIKKKFLALIHPTCKAEKRLSRRLAPLDCVALSATSVSAPVLTIREESHSFPGDLNSCLSGVPKVPVSSHYGGNDQSPSSGASVPKMNFSENETFGELARMDAADDSGIAMSSTYEQANNDLDSKFPDSFSPEVHTDLPHYADVKSQKIRPRVPERTCSITDKGRKGTFPTVAIPDKNSLLNVTVDAVNKAEESEKKFEKLSLLRRHEQPYNNRIVHDQVLRKDDAHHCEGKSEFNHSRSFHGNDFRKQLISNSHHLEGPKGFLDDSSVIHIRHELTEHLKKRKYRVGLNLFNKKPERGIAYLIRMRFLESSPHAVAKFLMTRKGLSKLMIGEYLGDVPNPFLKNVLECFTREIDLCSTHLDVALRKYLSTYFRLPGEAQKIERLMESFAMQYAHCNPDLVSSLFRSPDTVLVLAFAVVMLHTDLHSPSIRPGKKMKPEEFVRNLRGVDKENNLDREYLLGIYERIKNNEFRHPVDHVTQVLKVEQSIIGNNQTLALPHRRLVCYCRLYEVPDPSKRERPGLHQREVFLFNDLLVVTKLFNKKKSAVTYTFRQSFPLVRLKIILSENGYYRYLIRIIDKISERPVIIFNARNDHDRSNFAEDLRESICEMDETDNIRIELELEKQKSCRSRISENRDSGIADVEVGASLDHLEPSNLKKSALSNSLMNIHDADDSLKRRSSFGSLDSGMSISFNSTTNSNVSRGPSPQNCPNR